MEIRFNEYLDATKEIKFPVMDYREMVELQGDLKTLDEHNYSRLRSNLMEQGQLAPFFLWLDPETGKYLVVDGHQRKKIFFVEKVTPYERPYILIPGPTIVEAKKALLAISSQYGTITEIGYEKFTFNFPKEWLDQNVFFDGLQKKFTALEQHVKEDVSFAASTTKQFYLNVECSDEKQCQALYERFIKEGMKVKIVT